MTFMTPRAAVDGCPCGVPRRHWTRLSSLTSHLSSSCPIRRRTVGRLGGDPKDDHWRHRLYQGYSLGAQGFLLELMTSGRGIDKWSRCLVRTTLQADRDICCCSETSEISSELSFVFKSNELSHGLANRCIKQIH